MAQTGDFEHSNSNYGENLFGGSQIQNGGVPIYYWYKEWQDVNYDFSQNSMQGAGMYFSGRYSIPSFFFGESKNHILFILRNFFLGHFTQLVWKSSQRTGFGVATGQSWTYVVANYDPPGNNGDYLNNVSPPSDSDINSCASLQPEHYLDAEDILII